jgi:hypothetical protein
MSPSGQRKRPQSQGKRIKIHKKRPLHQGEAVSPRQHRRRLKAECFQLPPVAIKVTIPIPTTVSIPIEVPVPVKIAPHKPVPIVAPESPTPWNPITARHVAGRPEVSRPRTRRNVGNWSAHVNSNFGCLGLHASKTRCTCQYRCCQHPVLHAAHNPSVPAGPSFQKSETYLAGPALLGSQACLLLPCPLSRSCPVQTPPV